MDLESDRPNCGPATPRLCDLGIFLLNLSYLFYKMGLIILTMLSCHEVMFLYEKHSTWYVVGTQAIVDVFLLFVIITILDTIVTMSKGY